jgi:hypothetical protein
MQLTATSPGPGLFICLLPCRFPDKKVYEPVAADIDIDEELAKIIGQESLKEEIRRYGSSNTCFII